MYDDQETVTQANAKELALKWCEAQSELVYGQYTYEGNNLDKAKEGEYAFTAHFKSDTRGFVKPSTFRNLKSNERWIACPSSISKLGEAKNWAQRWCYQLN